MSGNLSSHLAEEKSPTAAPIDSCTGAGFASQHGVKYLTNALSLVIITPQPIK